MTAAFHAAALDRYLKSVLAGLVGTPEIEPIAGGQSNPTYFVSYGTTARLVLRKQPPGPLLPTAHAIDREYRVLGALAGTGVPVPRVRHYCADASIIGTPFYLMERVDGRVFHDTALRAAPRAVRRAMYRSLASALARLHAVDPDAVGLADFGRRGGYFARQIARWTKQWELSRDADDANIERLAAWLPGNIPDDHLSRISHGDYRVGNVMFAPDGAAVVAILDWELSTLGHPLADLAHCCMAWASTPEEYGGLRGLDLAAEGLPSRAEFEDWYGSDAGHGLRLQPFHMAFALFRFAVVFAGIAARNRAGNAAGDRQDADALRAAFARRAVEALG
jgi:aminoglycoside phosphotransferase (APT) family kinase protein